MTRPSEVSLVVLDVDGVLTDGRLCYGPDGATQKAFHVRDGHGIKMLHAAGEPVFGYPFDGYWQDLGRPDDYEQATLDFEKMRAQFLPEEGV